MTNRTRKELAQSYLSLTGVGAPTKWNKAHLEIQVTELEVALASEADQDVELVYTDEGVAVEVTPQHTVESAVALLKGNIKEVNETPDEVTVEDFEETIDNLLSPTNTEKPVTVGITCATADCENNVSAITDEYCSECMAKHYEIPHVVCQQCEKLVPKSETFDFNNGFICQIDCTKEKSLKSMVQHATAEAVNKPSKSRKTSQKSGPSKRQQVLDYISDLEEFTVEEVAQLLDTNMNNAATTCNLLITRPAKNCGPIPFERTAKGVYTRIATLQDNADTVTDEQDDSVVSIHTVVDRVSEEFVAARS